jgi:hypothetical protein
LCCNLVMYARFFDLLVLCIWDLSFSSGSCACSFSLRFATGCIVALVICVISMWDIWFGGCVVHVAMQQSYSLVYIHHFVVFWLLQAISQPSSRYLFGVLWLPRSMIGLWSVLCDIKLNSFFSGQDILPTWHFLLSVISLLISLSEALYCLVHTVHLIWISVHQSQQAPPKKEKKNFSFIWLVA